MPKSAFAAVTGIALLSACAAENPPLPTPGVAASAAGVVLSARVDAWPASLPEPQGIVPVLVNIENAGDMPVRLQYDRFHLVLWDGETVEPVVPVPLDAASDLVVDYAFQAEGFAVAPYLAEHYAALPAWQGEMTPPPLYFAAEPPIVRRLELPREAMVALALPEGVLAPGGRVRGFVYFNDVRGEAVEPDLDFRVELVDPQGTQIGAMFLDVPQTGQAAQAAAQ